MSLLIVDDDFTTTLLVQHMAKKIGFTCKTAVDGFEAVRSASAFNFDFILMDIYMPGLNGFDAAREIRSSCPGSEAIVIIGLLSGDEISMRSRCLEAGMDDVVMKPIDMCMLRECLSLRRQPKCLRNQHPQRDELENARPSVTLESNLSERHTPSSPGVVEIQEGQHLGHSGARARPEESILSPKNHCFTSIKYPAKEIEISVILFQVVLVGFFVIVLIQTITIACRPRPRSDPLLQT